MFLDSENLYLIQCTEEILRAAINGNEELASVLNCNISENWSEFGPDIFPYVLKIISENHDELPWWTYFPIHKEDNQLIGSGGYKGRPTKEGAVEIGYEITPNYWNRGLATELANCLITHAFSNNYIKVIYAHTLANQNASTGVLSKCGFVKVEELIDPNDGKVWKWKLSREIWFSRSD